MKYGLLISNLLFLSACTINKEEQTVAGEITQINEEEEEIWVDQNPLYVDGTDKFEVGEIVRVTFTAPATATDVYYQSEYEVIQVELLPADLYADLRKTAWTYLLDVVKAEVTAAEQSKATIETGLSNVQDPFVDLASPQYDNRPVWEVFYDVPRFVQPYKVLIDQESLEAIGHRRPEK